MAGSRIKGPGGWAGETGGPILASQAGIEARLTPSLNTVHGDLGAVCGADPNSRCTVYLILQVTERTIHDEGVEMSLEGK